MLKSRDEKLNYLKKFLPENGGVGLEIGPNLNPMVKKGEKWDIKYLDLVDTDKLIERARAGNQNVNLVPKIDYVYNPKNSISETVGEDKFDFVMSSHVIEHIPNLILHFQDIDNILNPGGFYCLIIPDMRLCFDVKKPATTLGTLIEAFVNNHKTAPISALIDEFKYGVSLGNEVAWSIHDGGKFVYRHDAPLKKIKNALTNSNILANWHGHIWRFTPYSFASIYLDCRELGLVGLELINIKPSSRMDFVCVLQKQPINRELFSLESLYEIANNCS